MESRIFFLLLGKAFVVAGAGAVASVGIAQEASTEQVPVIEPDIERREIIIPEIDTEDFEVGFFAGLMSIEDFGVSEVLGGRLAYHISENFFIEMAAGQSDAEETSFERLSGAAQLLTDDQRSLSYYNVSIGYNLLPGEVYLGTERAMNMALYFIGGVGSTKFAGDDRFTLNMGVGVRLIPRDWFAVHADLRDHIFDIDLLGREKTSHNLEAHIGVTFFF